MAVPEVLLQMWRRWRSSLLAFFTVVIASGCEESICLHPPVVETCVGSWCTIPAGCFMMGSLPGETLRETPTRETLHEVTLTRGFEILSTEVTQGDFRAIMGYNPSGFDACGDDCPVEQTSWHQAAAYCNALSNAGGLGACYTCTGGGAEVSCELNDAYASPYACPGYRLPTEAEWEYAARAGTLTSTYRGDFDAEDCDPSPLLGGISWYCGNSDMQTHAVGTLGPNQWGLHDMLGNVIEWCQDEYARDLGDDALTDPFTERAGALRVARGGSWFGYAQYARAAYRGWEAPDFESHGAIGFRPVRTLSQ